MHLCVYVCGHVLCMLFACVCVLIYECMYEVFRISVHGCMIIICMYVLMYVYNAYVC